MNTLLQIKASLEKFSGLSEIPNGVRVNTHCMYPNNGYVRVLVMGAGDEFYVSDEGGAFREAEVSGAVFQYSDKKFSKALAHQGLSMKHGIIKSPRVGADALLLAITLVANASKETAEWIFDHWKIEKNRKFKEILKESLRREFPTVQEQKITGVSNKPHSFDTVVQFLNGSRLLVDAVVKDSNSMNARVVANLDVKNAEYTGLTQRIVYDDDEEWNAEDLSLLRVSGVPIIPFSKSTAALRAIAATA